MLSKRERFRQWRGSKADNELQILDIALLFSGQVNSADNLNAIKSWIEAKFKEFNRDKLRSWATAVFAKLFVDEAIAQLPETAAEEKLLLIQLSSILTQLYDNWKSDPAKNINLLIDIVDKLLNIENIPFTEQKQYKTFLFSSYLLFQIIRLSLEKLNWSMQMAASLIVNVDQMKLKIASFLEKIEEREPQLKQFGSLEQGEHALDNDPLTSIKLLLNKRYLKVLSQTPLVRELQPVSLPSCLENRAKKKDLLASLKLFATDIERVSFGLEHLIAQRHQQAELETKIELINNLITAVHENERKITGRKYFFELLADHEQGYQVLLDNSDGVAKLHLQRSAAQLEKTIEAPNVSSGVINGLSWVASPLTVVYRTATPQMLQDVVSTTLPATLDSECKSKLKELAQLCLTGLKKQREKKENQIIAITNRFCSQDERMMQLITALPSEQLAQLQKANEVFKEAVQANTNLVTHIKDNLLFLHELKERRDTLSAFIRVHDTLLVKICHVLARFFSFFNTEKVQLVNEASALHKQANILAAEYQEAIDQQMVQVEQNPLFDEKIKNHLKRRLNAEERDLSMEQKALLVPDAQEVRLLMDNLSDLFVKTTVPVNEKIEEEQCANDGGLVFS